MSKRNSDVVQRTEKIIKLVPPDGGWGWMVLIGAGLSNILTSTITKVVCDCFYGLQIFYTNSVLTMTNTTKNSHSTTYGRGVFEWSFIYAAINFYFLLYGDALEAMGHETKGAAIVLSTMLFVTNFGGPMAGALIKVTSPRFVAVLGACFCTVGIFFSGFSTNIFHLILTYGISLGLGLGFIQNASFVSINGYFKLKKNFAVGLAMVGTGIGQTLMPHVVRYFLTNYGFKNACILLGSLSLHGICGTMLIQPVEWHMKKVEEEVIIDEKVHLLEEKNNVKNEDYTSNGEASHKNENRDAAVDINVKSDLKSVSLSYKELQVRQNTAGIEKRNSDLEATKPKKTLLKKIYDLFDISLLSSPRFLNIIIGTALTVVSIQNFSMIFPLFLQKAASMDKHQTATCMSFVAMADIVGRLVLPMLQDKYQIKARMMLIMTSVWLIVVRQILANQTELYVLLTLSAMYGFGRSMVIVARNIAISEHCRPEQVPSAVGLGMLTMGIIVPPVGYFLGWIRDYTDSFTICITAQNLLLVLFLAMWIPDMIYLYYKERQKKNKNDEKSLS